MTVVIARGKIFEKFKKNVWFNHFKICVGWVASGEKKEDDEH